MLEIAKMYRSLGGSLGGLPSIHSFAQKSEKGTAFLQAPGVVMIGKTGADLGYLAHFLEEMDDFFGGYLEDPNKISDGALLAKFAGQLCYLSLGEKRTKNDRADAYFGHIIESGHGSILEHVSYSFLFYGISRSCTHELVRHRLSSYSQVSQRYVSGKHLRFVERPEFVANETLHRRFKNKIDQDAEYYEETVQMLLREREAGATLLTAEGATEARKKVQQAARESLPNCTEAPIVVTMNARSWRHFFGMRAASPAEIEIRRLAFFAFLCASQVDPLLWQDATIRQLEDETWVVDLKRA